MSFAVGHEGEYVKSEGLARLSSIPHTAAEISIDGIKNLCDDLFEAHGK